MACVYHHQNHTATGDLSDVSNEIADAMLIQEDLEHVMHDALHATYDGDRDELTIKEIIRGSLEHYKKMTSSMQYMVWFYFVFIYCQK